jgi:hypothetical protein
VTNQPLSSSDQSKILIFSLLLAATLVLGAIPVIFIGFGVFMLKKQGDFSHIETAVSNSKAYISLVSIGFLIAAFYARSSDSISFLFAAGVALTYIILINVLFFKPLKSHREWIEKNGIFSSISDSTPSNISIIQNEKLKQYSVADELIKWTKLKEDGHISERDFNEAKDKLIPPTKNGYL